MDPELVELLRRADQLLCGYAAKMGIETAGKVYPARYTSQDRTAEQLEADDVIQQIRVILRRELPGVYS